MESAIHNINPSPSVLVISEVFSTDNFTDDDFEFEKIIYNNKADVIFLEVYVQEFLS